MFLGQAAWFLDALASLETTQVSEWVSRNFAKVTMHPRKSSQVCQNIRIMQIIHIMQFMQIVLIMQIMQNMQIMQILQIMQIMKIMQIMQII